MSVVRWLTALAPVVLVVACGGSGGGGDVEPGGESGAPSGSSSGGAPAGSSSGGVEAGGAANDAAPPDASGGADAAPAGDGAAPSVDGGLNPSLPPGGNFDLSLWQLQEPIGSPGSPTTIPTSKLVGPNGFHDTYFFTDPTDGSMSFWDPEDGVTTANSNYPRSELREMTASGAAANWMPTGTNTLSATVKATQVPDHVCVGQIHLGTGTPSSTKPLLELFYFASGEIRMAIEQSPAGGNEISYTVGTVPLGTPFSYVIGLAGSTISLTIDGGAGKTWTMDPSFAEEGMYFKAGDYDQSAGSSATVGAKVQFYALAIHHGP